LGFGTVKALLLSSFIFKLASLNEVTLDATEAFNGVDVTSVPTLKSDARASNRFGDFYRGSTLNEIARYGGYTSYDPPGNTDPFVAEAMKSWNRPLYDSIRGFTRRGAGVSGLYDALLKFDGTRHDMASLSPHQRACMLKAISATRERFTLPTKEQPLDWHEVGKYLRTDTSAGVTWPGKKKGEVLEEIYPAARWLGHRMKQGGKRFNPSAIHFPPCLAAKRGHMSEKTAPKTRMVWIYPAEMLTVEGLYAPRMYERFMELKDSPLLLGSTPSRMASSFGASHSSAFKKLGVDFSAFDSSVPSFLIKIAFDILHRNINWDEWNGKPVSKSQKRKWRNVWDNMVWYFINTPVLMPDGRMFRKYRGVPSGTFWTSLIDSVVNHLLIQYLAEEQGQEVHNLKVLGDDSACHVRDFDVPRASSVAKSCFGMTVNGPKTELLDSMQSFKLLGTTYRKGAPYREDEEWFKLLLYPEAPVRDVDQSMSRLVGLWLAGAMYSSLYCEFWQYYQSGYPCPSFGRFSRGQRRGLTALLGSDPGEWWRLSSPVFERPYEVHR
jgi:hypothetical protein